MVSLRFSTELFLTTKRRKCPQEGFLFRKQALLHFSSRTFNLLFFLMKVFKLIRENNSLKWKLLHIWVKTKTAKQIVLLLNFWVKNSLPAWLKELFLWIFIKNTMENFFWSFLNQIGGNSFNSLHYFPQSQQSFWQSVCLPCLFMASNKASMVFSLPIRPKFLNLLTAQEPKAFKCPSSKTFLYCLYNCQLQAVYSFEAPFMETLFHQVFYP